MKKILVVEDDHRLSESVTKALEKEGYGCEPAFDGHMALKYFQQGSYQLVLLDINLPKMNGMDLCRKFRETNAEIPILIITAFGDIDSKMEAFTLGADDYLVKPFHLRELLAKVKVFLKRAEQPNAAQPLYQLQDIKLDPNKKIAIREGKEINLTPKEYGLLEYMLKNRNRIISKDELAMNLWDANYGVTHNTIEVYINFLRNKIDKEFEKKLILTKPGFGYYLNDQRDEL
ncbi:response regulator transcription factor [Chryseolinea soli]|uniref:DNA-binding response regulator n=1 Tax=Chryseolinea soli TaxID=2321403 RepID=A0A385SLM4_9BACT|nr:response regulator transcription factor [Chryseolinea soli]AYB31712.1 DNA-binding response regulator [Chryseolinea soli]